MDIRPYQEADEPAVIALWREVLPDAAPHNEPGQAIRQKRAFELDLLFVAAVEGIVVGTIMGGYDGHRGWVYSVAVRPEHRGPGSVRHWSVAWSGRWPSAAA